MTLRQPVCVISYAVQQGACDETSADYWETLSTIIISNMSWNKWWKVEKRAEIEFETNKQSMTRKFIILQVS